MEMKGREASKISREKWKIKWVTEKGASKKAKVKQNESWWNEMEIFYFLIFDLLKWVQLQSIFSVQLNLWYQYINLSFSTSK